MAQKITKLETDSLVVPRAQLFHVRVPVAQVIGTLAASLLKFGNHRVK